MDPSTHGYDFDRRPEAGGSFGLQSLGDYLLIGEIGSGAMGIVYSARQLRTNRPVALKLLSPGAKLHPQALARFRTEVEATAALDHPNIVPVFDAGEVEGRPFLAMKLVEGENLAAWLARRAGPAPLQSYTQIAGWIAVLARAVHHAHERGVLHRDLKPHNVLLDEQSIPHLTDFGIAKILDTPNHATLTHALLGTPSYMSPEQASGKARSITFASDIYGLGSILYELLSGAPPFESTDLNDLLQKIQNEEPKRPSHRLSAHSMDEHEASLACFVRQSKALRPQSLPSSPEDLETICLKCLEKDPNLRYPTSAELAQDLDRWLQGRPITARPVSDRERLWRWIRRHPLTSALLAGIAVTVTLGLLGTTWQWRHAEAQRHKAEAGQTQLRLQRTEDHLASDHTSLAVAELARLVRDQPQNRIAAERLANLLNQRVFMLPQERLPPVFQEPLDRSHNGNVAAHIYDAIHVHCFRGGDTFPFLILSNAHAQVIRNITFSPDGKRLATASGDHTAGIWDIPSGRRLLTLRHSEGLHSIAYSPDGTMIVTTSRDRTAILWNAMTGLPLGEPMRHLSAVNFAGFSPDGQKLITVSDDKSTRVWSVDTNNERHYSEARASEEVAEWGRFAEDSRHIVISLASGRKQAFVLTRGFEQTTTTTPVATNWASGLPPEIASRHSDRITFFDRSQDQRWLVTASKGGRARIWSVRSLQSQCDPLIHATAVNCARFSPDSLRLLTSTAEPTQLRVWDVESGLPLTDWMNLSEPVSSAQFSEDSQWIVTSSGWKTPVSTVFGSTPAWLAPFAESIAGLRITEEGQTEPVSPESFLDIKNLLLKLSETDPLHKWAKRLVADEP